MGLRRTLAEAFPRARHQRCWVHRTRDVINALPKSAQPGAEKARQEITGAKDRTHAEQAVKAFENTYGAKWPTAATKITKDAGELLALYGSPTEHWIHPRTTNPIEPAFGTTCPRTTVTRGAGGPAAAPAMVLNLAEADQARRRAVSALHPVAVVRSGARFENGVLAGRQEQAA